LVGALSAVAYAGKFEVALEEHKGTVVEFSVGFVGGSIVSTFVKSMTKFGLVAGVGVFLVSNKLVDIVLPKMVENQDELIGEAAQEVEKRAKEIGKAATKMFDFNGDGTASLDDFKSARAKVVPIVKKHMPFSLGFFGGFIKGL